MKLAATVTSRVLLSFVAVTTSAEASAEPPGPFPLTVQTRDAKGKPASQQITIDPVRTAVVVIDMWDRHWCETYTERVGNMVPRMNRTLAAARKLGIQVVVAPSDVLDFYRDAPQRKAMQPLPDPHPRRPGQDPGAGRLRRR